MGLQNVCEQISARCNAIVAGEPKIDPTSTMGCTIQ
jgi:hypothetical protein